MKTLAWEDHGGIRLWIVRDDKDFNYACVTEHEIMILCHDAGQPNNTEEVFFVDYESDKWAEIADHITAELEKENGD